MHPEKRANLRYQKKQSPTEKKKEGQTDLLPTYGHAQKRKDKDRGRQ